MCVVVHHSTTSHQCRLLFPLLNFKAPRVVVWLPPTKQYWLMQPEDGVETDAIVAFVQDVVDGNLEVNTCCLSCLLCGS